MEFLTLLWFGSLICFWTSRNQWALQRKIFMVRTVEKAETNPIKKQRKKTYMKR